MKTEKIFTFILILVFGAGIAVAQFVRGSYNKKLLFVPRQDMKQLPKTKKFRILRSIGKKTHVAVFDMTSIIFYIDRDNTTEDTIDVVYRVDPWDRKVLKRISNPLDKGKFSLLKTEIVKQGLRRNPSFYSFPGLDRFKALAEKDPYRIIKRDKGYLVQFRDPDSKKVQSALGINFTKNRLTIKTNYYFSSGKWREAGIIYPVNIVNTSDPTLLRLIKEGDAAFADIYKNRK